MEDTKFVRVYDGVNSCLEGGRVIKAEDIKVKTVVGGVVNDGSNKGGTASEVEPIPEPNPVVEGGTDTNIQSKLDDLLNSDYYKYDPGYDCSEIAQDFYNAAENQGHIYRIEGKSGIINGYEYNDILEFDYHEVYTDGINIYDPRFKNIPIPKDDYFRALKEINPDGFDVFTIK